MAVLPNASIFGGSSAPHSHMKRELSRSAVVGVGVGVPAALLFLASAIVAFRVFFISRRKKSKGVAPAAPAELQSESYTPAYSGYQQPYQPQTLYGNPPTQSIYTGQAPGQLTSDQFLENDKESLPYDRRRTQQGMSQTPDFRQCSFLFTTPTAVGCYRDADPNFVPPQSLPLGVNPWDVEYGPNPVIFSNLAEPVPDSGATASESKAPGDSTQPSGQADPDERQELDAIETETTRSAAPGVLNAPHAWEVTKGSKTMPDAEYDMYYNGMVDGILDNIEQQPETL
ncbi:Nn.00g046400.m01.CDS01 [Neocucurbitaria sp. VM-36]